MDEIKLFSTAPHKVMTNGVAVKHKSEIDGGMMI